MTRANPTTTQSTGDVTMRILGLLKADVHSEAGAPPSKELIERMGGFIEEITKAGVMLATDGLQPSSKGKRVRLADGKITVIDGPFTESKELVASYAVFQVKSMDEAVHWSTRFLQALGKGECELRPIFDPEDFTPDVFKREEATRGRMRKNAASDPMTKITVQATIAAPIERVWAAYTNPEDIRQWNAASDDWHTTKATVDLRVGGAFSSRMEAKDGSHGFDFAGIYTKIVEHRLIEYSFGDRTAQVEFTPDGKVGVTVRVTFDSESTHSVEQQRSGWQAILDNFARHVRATTIRSARDTASMHR